MLCCSWRIQSSSVKFCGVDVLDVVEDGRNSSGSDRGDDWSLLCCCCVIAAAREETAAADDDDDEAAVLLDEWRCFFAMEKQLLWLLDGQVI